MDVLAHDHKRHGNKDEHDADSHAHGEQLTKEQHADNQSRDRLNGTSLPIV